MLYIIHIDSDRMWCQDQKEMWPRRLLAFGLLKYICPALTWAWTTTEIH